MIFFLELVAALIVAYWVSAIGAGIFAVFVDHRLAKRRKEQSSDRGLFSLILNDVHRKIRR